MTIGRKLFIQGTSRRDELLVPTGRSLVVADSTNSQFLTATYRRWRLGWVH